MSLRFEKPISKAQFNLPRFPTARSIAVVVAIDLVVGGRVVVSAGPQNGREKWAMCSNIDHIAFATPPVRSRGRRLSLLPLRREPRCLVRVPRVGRRGSSEAPARVVTLLVVEGDVAVS